MLTSSLAAVVLVLTVAPVPPGADRSTVRFGLMADKLDYLPILLLVNPFTRDELRLTEEQVAKATALSRALRAGVYGARALTEEQRAAHFETLTKETEEAIVRLLTPAQNTR